MSCRTHKWIPVIDEDTSKLTTNQLVDLMLEGRHFKNYVFCTQCNKIGHQIRSRRGGIRTHDNYWRDQTLERINKLRAKLGMTLLEVLPSNKYENGTKNP